MLLRALALAAVFAFGGSASAQTEATPSWRPAPESAARPSVTAPAEGWSTTTGLYADVHGEWADRATVTRLANHAATSAPALAKRLGVRPGATMDVYVMPTEAAFHELQPGRTPDWADGTAWPRWSLIFLKSPSIRSGTATNLEVVLDHELVHILLGRAFGPRPVPRWLQEGLAQFYSGEASWERSIALAKNDFGLAPLPLGTITTGFPPDALQAQLAYAQSADFIAWIAGRNGEGALRSLIAEMASGAKVGDAVRAATGLSLEEANDAWLGSVPTASAWYRWATNSQLHWAIGAGFLGLAAWRRTQAGKVKMARWEAEEAARNAELFRQAELRAAAAENDGIVPWALVPLAPPRPRRVVIDPQAHGAG